MINPISNINLHYNRLSPLSLDGISRMQSVFSKTPTYDHLSLAGQKAYQQQHYVQFTQQVTRSTEMLHQYAWDLYRATNLFGTWSYQFSRPPSPSLPVLPPDPVDPVDPPDPVDPTEPTDPTDPGGGASTNHPAITVEREEGGFNGTFDIQVFEVKNDYFKTWTDTVNANDTAGDHMEMFSEAVFAMYQIGGPIEGGSMIMTGADFGPEADGGIDVQPDDTLGEVFGKIADKMNELNQAMGYNLHAYVEDMGDGQIRLVLEETENSTEHIQVISNALDEDYGFFGLNTKGNRRDDTHQWYYEIRTEGTGFIMSSDSNSIYLPGYGTITIHDTTYNKETGEYDIATASFYNPDGNTMTSTHGAITSEGGGHKEGTFEIRVEQWDVTYEVENTILLEKNRHFYNYPFLNELTIEHPDGTTEVVNWHEMGIHYYDTVGEAMTKFVAYANSFLLDKGVPSHYQLIDDGEGNIAVSYVKHMAPGGVGTSPPAYTFTYSAPSLLEAPSTMTRTESEIIIQGEGELDGLHHTASFSGEETYMYLDGYGAIRITGPTTNGAGDLEFATVTFTKPAAATSSPMGMMMSGMSSPSAGSTHPDAVTAESIDGGLTGEFQVKVEQYEVPTLIHYSMEFNKATLWETIVPPPLPGYPNMDIFYISRYGHEDIKTIPFASIGISSEATIEEAFTKFVNYANEVLAQSNSFQRYFIEETTGGNIRVGYEMPDLDIAGYSEEDVAIGTAYVHPHYYFGVGASMGGSNKTVNVVTVEGKGTYFVTNDVITIEDYGTLQIHGPTENTLGEAEFATVTFNDIPSGGDPPTGSSKDYVPPEEITLAKLEEFLAAYNNMVQFTNEHSAFIRNNVASFLKSAPSLHADSLQKIGISLREDGSLLIEDRRKLEGALSEDPRLIEDAFFRAYRGVVTEARILSEKIITSPFGTFATENVRVEQSLTGHSEKVAITHSVQHLIQEAIVDTFKDTFSPFPETSKKE